MIPDCRDVIWQRREHIMSARETRLCGISSTEHFLIYISGGFLLTDVLDEAPVFLPEQVRPEMFFSSGVLRTTKVQICVTSQGKDASESVPARSRNMKKMCFSKRVLRTNTVTEVHNRLCATYDHFLVISAYLDYYRTRRGRTA
jgi:hypothetical protein